MRTEEEIVKGSVWHVLNFTNATVMEYTFALAFEKELADMKGLMKGGSFCDVLDEEKGLYFINTELELLESLKDPAIVILVDTIHKLIDCANTYFIIIGIDLEELATDDQYNYMAGGTWNSMYFELKEEGYDALLQTAGTLYHSMLYVLYTAAYQLILKRADVYEVSDDEFWKNYHPLLVGELKVEDPLAQILIDLIAELQKDAMRI